MKIIINDRECDIPFELSQVTLGQYRDFIKTHGKAIELDSKIEPLCWYQFFSGFDFLGSDDFIQNQIIEQYRTLAPLLKDESTVPEFITEPIEWSDELWSFQTFADEQLEPTKHWYNYKNVHYASRIFPLFQKNQWFYLPHLCGVFFRRENEELFEYAVHDQSKRFQLMLELPLNIAIAVKNHLLASLNQN